MIENHQHNKRQLLGVVLCGGESKRMGKDKGLLSIEDSIWAKHIGGKIELLNMGVVYSVNQQQEETYQLHIDKAQLIPDFSTANGPLKGLLSVYFRFPANDFLVVACDMPDIRQSTLYLLLDAYHRGYDDFYAFGVGGFYEPLCAIYTGYGLDKIFKGTEEGKLLETSLQSILQRGETKKIEAGKEEAFNNYNS